MIVVVKCISSLRYRGTIVITIIENDGMYEFRIKPVGFRLKVNFALNFDSFSVWSNVGSLTEN